jgi:hypothetical protein
LREIIPNPNHIAIASIIPTFTTQAIALSITNKIIVASVFLLEPASGDMVSKLIDLSSVAVLSLAQLQSMDKLHH